MSQPQKSPLSINSSSLQDDTLTSDQHNIKILAPSENKAIFYKNILLQWENPRSLPYRLVLSEDKDFKSVLVDTILQKDHFNIAILKRHQDYFWCIGDNHDKIDTHFEQITFFKTTSILLDEVSFTDKLEIIPTWIDNKDVLYFYNPDKNKYNLLIYNEKNDIILNKRLYQDKHAISTESWVSGMYKIKIEFADLSTHTKYFRL